MGELMYWNAFDFTGVPNDVTNKKTKFGSPSLLYAQIAF